MTTKNDVTGDMIATKSCTDAYREGCLWRGSGEAYDESVRRKGK